MFMMTMKVDKLNIGASGVYMYIYIYIHKHIHTCVSTCVWFCLCECFLLTYQLTYLFITHFISFYADKGAQAYCCRYLGGRMWTACH